MPKHFPRNDDLDQARQAEVPSLAAVMKALLAWMPERP